MFHLFLQLSTWWWHKLCHPNNSKIKLILLFFIFSFHFFPQENFLEYFFLKQITDGYLSVIWSSLLPNLYIVSSYRPCILRTSLVFHSILYIKCNVLTICSSSTSSISTLMLSIMRNSFINLGNIFSLLFLIKYPY